MSTIALIKHYAVYLLGTILVNASGFFLIPIYTRYLATEEFGILEVINVSVEISSIIFSAGIGMACLSLYSKEQEVDEKNQIVSTAIIDMLLLAIVGMSLFLVVSNKINEILFEGSNNLYLLRIAGLLMLCQLSLSVPMAYIQARMNSKLFISVASSQSVIAITINIILVVYMGMGIKGILLGNLTTSFVFAVCLTTYTLIKTGIHHNIAVSGRLFMFGLPFIPGGLFQFVLHSADRYFIQRLLDSSTLGIYSVGYKMGTLVALLVLGPFLRIWGPYMFKLDKEIAKDKAFGKYFLYIVTAYCVAALPAALFGREIIQVMAGAEYWSGYEVVPYVLLAYLFWTIATFFDSGFYITERTIYKPFIMGIAAALIFVLYWKMIPVYGMLGGAYATLICFAVFSLLTYLVSNKIYPIRYPLLKFGYILVIGIVFYLIGSNIPDQQGILGISGRAFLVLCYPLTLIAIGAIRRSDLQAVRTYGRSLWHRLTYGTET
jgi:O-antigen/teichoic acid export membrane protein